MHNQGRTKTGDAGDTLLRASPIDSRARSLSHSHSLTHSLTLSIYIYVCICIERERSSPAGMTGVERYLRRPAQTLGKCPDICHCRLYVILLHPGPCTTRVFGARSAELRLRHLAVVIPVCNTFPACLLLHVASTSPRFPGAHGLRCRCFSRRSGRAILLPPVRERDTLSGAERPLGRALVRADAARHH